jgi:hypothetical protein
MLFGEYVTTIWWPNWDALAGPPGPDGGDGLLLVATGSYSGVTTPKPRQRRRKTPPPTLM